MTHEKTSFEGGLITLYEPATMMISGEGVSQRVTSSAFAKAANTFSGA